MINEIKGRRSSLISESMRSSHISGKFALDRSDTVKAAFTAIDEVQFVKMLASTWHTLGCAALCELYQIRTGQSITMERIVEIVPSLKPKSIEVVDEQAQPDFRLPEEYAETYRRWNYEERYIRRLNQLYEKGFIGIIVGSVKMGTYRCAYTLPTKRKSHAWMTARSLDEAILWQDDQERKYIPSVWRVLMSPTLAEWHTFLTTFKAIYPRNQVRLTNILEVQRKPITRKLIYAYYTENKPHLMKPRSKKR